LQAALAAAAQAGAASRIQARLAYVAEAARRPDHGARAQALLDAMAGELAAAPPLLQAEALRVRTQLFAWQGRHDAAVACEREAIALLQSQADALLPLGELLDTAARRALTGGAAAEAEALAQRAVAALEAADAPGALAQALVLQGVGAMEARGDAESARGLFERARRLAAGCGHVPAQRAALLNLVKLHTDRGEADAALALVDEGLALAPGFEHAASEQAFAQARYYVHYLRGDVAAADAAACHLLALARRVAERHVLPESLLMVADLYLLTGRLAEAGALLDEAEASGAATHPDELRIKRAWWCWRSGRLAAAEQALPGADAALRHENRALLAWVGAAIALARGDAALARSRLRAALPPAQMTVEMQAMWLLQALRLDAGDAASRAQAEALLASRRAPALEARLLRRALNPG
jgi:hypothetical protein